MKSNKNVRGTYIASDGSGALVICSSKDGTNMTLQVVLDKSGLLPYLSRDQLREIENVSSRLGGRLPLMEEDVAYEPVEFTGVAGSVLGNAGLKAVLDENVYDMPDIDRRSLILCIDDPDKHSLLLGWRAADGVYRVGEFFSADHLLIALQGSGLSSFDFEQVRHMGEQAGFLLGTIRPAIQLAGTLAGALLAGDFQNVAKVFDFTTEPHKIN